MAERVQHLVNISGGKDSAAIYLRAIELALCERSAA